MKKKIEELLSGIRPILVMQGKDISVVEATEQRIALSLSGFCGDCGCTMNYVEGIKEMINRQFPHVKEIQLDMADAE